jgi:hypothetical protein
MDGGGEASSWCGSHSNGHAAHVESPPRDWAHARAPRPCRRASRSVSIATRDEGHAVHTVTNYSWCVSPDTPKRRTAPQGPRRARPALVVLVALCRWAPRVRSGHATTSSRSRRPGRAPDAGRFAPQRRRRPAAALRHALRRRVPARRPRPKDAWPRVPAGFRVRIYADQLVRPPRAAQRLRTAICS